MCSYGSAAANERASGCSDWRGGGAAKEEEEGEEEEVVVPVGAGLGLELDLVCRSRKHVQLLHGLRRRGGPPPRCCSWGGLDHSRLQHCSRNACGERVAAVRGLGGQTQALVQILWNRHVKSINSTPAVSGISRTTGLQLHLQVPDLQEVLVALGAAVLAVALQHLAQQADALLHLLDGVQALRYFLDALLGFPGS
ncbi:hypothetical protein EYF80_031805 [Liparis tanakae]|uniref:Uncharacterized protein n=1 Tax=Liparis tanakae TaxID=230148 RepID=A0A4Z2GXD8_9TELE|nr:hypothetical protein EYF80_031805 [Liparis tanakae]